MAVLVCVVFGACFPILLVSWVSLWPNEWDATHFFFFQEKQKVLGPLSMQSEAWPGGSGSDFHIASLWTLRGKALSGARQGEKHSRGEGLKA